MNERTITIASIVVLSLTVLGGGAGIYYLHGVKAAKVKDRTALEGEVKDHETKRAAIPGLKKKVAELKDKIKAGEERVPKLDELQYDEMADLIDNLRKLSSTHISDARFAGAARGKQTSATMARAQYDLTVRGGFFNLLRLINLLEAQKRHISIESFSISPGPGGLGKGGTVVPLRDMRLRLVTFTRKVAPAPQAQPTSTTQKPPEQEKQQSTPLPP